MYWTDADLAEEKRDLNLSKENSFRNSVGERENLEKSG